MKSKILKKKISKELPLDIIYEKYPKYRFLSPKEEIRCGDEYFAQKSWHKTGLSGGYPRAFEYRRRVSLEKS